MSASRETRSAAVIPMSARAGARSLAPQPGGSPPIVPPIVPPDAPPAAAAPAASGFPNYTHAQIVRMLSGIILCILLSALDQTVVVPAVPAIATDLNGFGHLAWIVTAYLLTSTAATPIYGKLSDIWGRRAMLLPSIVFFVIASVLCGSVNTLPQLIICRALQGIGGGGLAAMSQAVIADIVAPRERGRYQGYMASTWAFASVAGPIVGGALVDHLSWRWVFWINVPLGIGAFILSRRALRNLRHRRLPARIDYLGAALLTAGVTCWLLVLSWGGSEFAWDSPQILGLLAGGLALLVALAIQEMRTPDPLLPPRLFRNKTLLGGVALAFFGSLGLFAGIFLLPLYLQLARGFDAGTAGVLVVPYLVIGPVGSYIAGQRARRSGRTKAIVLSGLGVTTAGFGLLGLLGLATPLALVLFDMLVVGFGIGLTMPSVLVMVQNAAERRDVGAATGVLLFLRSMGGAFGSTLGGTVLAQRFNAALAPLGLAGKIDLGAVRGDAGVLARLPPASQAEAMHGLLSGFTLSFAICCGVTLLAWGLAAAMRDTQLRSGAQEPMALGH